MCIRDSSKTEIKDAIRDLQKQSESSDTQHDYPCTLQDVAPWMQPIMSLLLPTLLSASLLLLGEKGAGKTPLAIILALAVARYWASREGVQDPAGYRVCQDLDSLKKSQAPEWSPSSWTTLTSLNGFPKSSRRSSI
eukprot:9965720-Karenia_brevis.AAC.1